MFSFDRGYPIPTDFTPAKYSLTVLTLRFLSGSYMWKTFHNADAIFSGWWVTRPGHKRHPMYAIYAKLHTSITWSIVNLENEWSMANQSQKYHVYMKYLPLRPKFWSVSLYSQRFQRYRTCYHSPLTTMLYGQKKEPKNLPKIQNLKFHYSFNKFIRDPPQEYTWILASKSGVLFQRRCRLKFFLPYGPMLTKTKKKNHKKSKILNFEKPKKKKKKNDMEIWWIGTCPQNLALIHSGVSEKTMSTDDGRWRTPAWRQ